MDHYTSDEDLNMSPKPRAKRSRKRVESDEEDAEEAKNDKSPKKTRKIQSKQKRGARNVRKKDLHSELDAKEKSTNATEQDSKAFTELLDDQDRVRPRSSNPTETNAKSLPSSPTSKVSKMKRKTVHKHKPSKDKPLKRNPEYVEVLDDEQPVKKKPRTAPTVGMNDEDETQVRKPISDKRVCDTVPAKIETRSEIRSVTAPKQLSVRDKDPPIYPENVLQSPPMKNTRRTQDKPITSRSRVRKENLNAPAVSLTLYDHFQLLTYVQPENARQETNLNGRRTVLKAVACDDNLPNDEVTVFPLCSRVFANIFKTAMNAGIQKPIDLPKQQDTENRAAKPSTRNTSQKAVLPTKVIELNICSSLEDCPLKDTHIKMIDTIGTTAQFDGGIAETSLPLVKRTNSRVVNDNGSPLTPLSSADEADIVQIRTEWPIGSARLSEKEDRSKKEINPRNLTLMNENERLVKEFAQEADCNDTDIDFNDLTEDDIKEVLQSLRSHRQKRQAKSASRQKIIGARANTIELSDAEKSASRSKVKFDDRPKYKSASFEVPWNPNTSKDPLKLEEGK